MLPELAHVRKSRRRLKTGAGDLAAAVRCPPVVSQGKWVAGTAAGRAASYAVGMKGAGSPVSAARAASAITAPQYGPTVSPLGPIPVAIHSRSTPRAGPSNGKPSKPTGRRPTRADSRMASCTLREPLRGTGSDDSGPDHDNLWHDATVSSRVLPGSPELQSEVPGVSSVRREGISAWAPCRTAMTDRIEGIVERRIREAQERGAFDNLPGAGKPLGDRGGPRDENWWLRQYLLREGLSGVPFLPPALALRKEVEELPALVAALSTEAQVRVAVGALNDRILSALRKPVEGPSMTVMQVVLEVVLLQWRLSRTGARTVPVVVQDAATTSTSRRRRWWFRRS